MTRRGLGRGRSGEVEQEVVLGGDVDEGERLHGRGLGPEGGPGRRRPVGNPRSPPVRGVGIGEERRRCDGEASWRDVGDGGSRVGRLGIKNVREGVAGRCE